MSQERMYDLLNAYAEARAELLMGARFDTAHRRTAAKLCLMIAQEFAGAYSPGATEHSAWLRLASDAAAILMKLPSAKQQGIADSR